MTEHERLLQGAVNFVRMLETMYDTDIGGLKPSAIYVALYNRWINEGCPMGVIENVRYKRSQDARRASGDVVWNPLDIWDRKKLPLRWKDAAH